MDSSCQINNIEEPTTKEPINKKKKFNIAEMVIYFTFFLTLIMSTLVMIMWFDNSTDNRTANTVVNNVPKFINLAVGIKDGDSSSLNSNQLVGSGFLYQSNGSETYIVTARHVVEALSTILVTDSYGNSYPAKLIASDPFSDVSVLRIEIGNLAQVSVANGIGVGEEIYAVGAPYGFSNTVTRGIISGSGRAVSSGGFGNDNGLTLHNALQLDAPINPGNSGGPVFNANGELVGMVSAIWSETDSNTGVSFAVPAENVTRVANDLIKYGFATHKYIGITLATNTNGKVVVEKIVPNSPASKVFKEGDIIISANGQAVNKPEIVTSAIQSINSGQSIGFRIEREGDTISVSTKVLLTK